MIEHVYGGLNQVIYGSMDPFNDNFVLILLCRNLFSSGVWLICTFIISSKTLLPQVVIMFDLFQLY
jgi:hypothetical protein